MPNWKIRKILYAHGIPSYEQNEHVYADTMCGGNALFEEVEDLTGYTVQQLRDWLGY